MEENKIERELMTNEEFKDYIQNGSYYPLFETLEGLTKFRSLKRALRRGHITFRGTIMPKRPFSNRANTCKRGKHSRTFNELKKQIYEQFKRF